MSTFTVHPVRSPSQPQSEDQLQQREEAIRKRDELRKQRAAERAARQPSPKKPRDPKPDRSQAIEALKLEREKRRAEQAAAREKRLADRKTRLEQMAANRGQAQPKATRPARSPKARDKSAADFPCSMRGQIEGRLICNCRNKPDVYQCSAEFNTSKLCIASPMSQTMDGPLVKGGKKSSEHYLPWQVEESEPRGKPMGDLIRVPVCSLCPHRLTPSINVISDSQFGELEVINEEAKIAVVTGYTASNAMWRQIGDITSSTMRDYCAEHGYGFRCHRAGFEPRIHPSWSKIKFLRNALRSHETVLWLDADAMVTNPYGKIERLHPHGREGLCVCTDPVAINCGTMLLTRTAFTTWLLENVWDDRMSTNRLWEQDTINSLHKHGCLADNIRICQPRHFNSRYPSHESPLFDWRPGDFVCHVYRTSGNIGLKLSSVSDVCNMADDGVSLDKIEESTCFLESVKDYQGGTFSGNGIVTSAGGRSLELNAYVMIRLLRHLGCTLPIECWYDGDREYNARFGEMIGKFGVEYINAKSRGFDVRLPSTAIRHAVSGIQYSGSGRKNIAGYSLKPFAMLNSRFKRVLWMDADCFPVNDPTHLLFSDEIKEFGAIGWPDAFRGIGPNLRAFGVCDTVVAGLETGQFAVDKERCWRAMNLDSWYNSDPEYWYKHSWGDTDTRLAAWLMTNTGMHMMLPVKNDNVVFGQRDTNGEILFCHRVAEGKLSLERPVRHVDWFPHDVKVREFMEEYSRDS